MEDMPNNSRVYHQAIETKHVFIEDHQVFLKREHQKLSNQEWHEAIWRPVNFQWIPNCSIRTRFKAAVNRFQLVAIEEKLEQL